MASKKEIEQFIKSQQSIHLYCNIRVALRDVLLSMPDKDYKKATHNLILMVLHEKALAQVMHFPKSAGFRIMQVTIPDKVPLSVLRYVLAHEFGHVMQGRNWERSDGMKLEDDADIYAEKIGFPRTKYIDEWIKRYRNKNK
jgi:hypothetical protein